MNFVVDLAHRSLCGSVVVHQSAESKGLRKGSSRRLKIFSLSYARDETKNIFLCFIYVSHYRQVTNLTNISKKVILLCLPQHSLQRLITHHKRTNLTVTNQRNTHNE